MKRIVTFLMIFALIAGAICFGLPQDAHAAECSHHNYVPVSEMTVHLNGHLTYNVAWRQAYTICYNGDDQTICPDGHTYLCKHTRITNLTVNGAPAGGGNAVNSHRINVSGSVSTAEGYMLHATHTSIPVYSDDRSDYSLIQQTASTGTIYIQECGNCQHREATWNSGAIWGVLTVAQPTAIPDLSITLKDIYMKKNGNRIECETSASGTPLVVPDRDIYFVAEITNADKDITAPIDVTASGMSGGLSITSTSKLINCSAAAPFEVDDTREVTFVGRIQNTGQNLFAFDVCVNYPDSYEAILRSTTNNLPLLTNGSLPSLQSLLDY